MKSLKQFAVILAALAILPAASAQADGIIQMGSWTDGSVNVHFSASESGGYYIGAVPAVLDGTTAIDVYCVSDLNIGVPGTWNYVGPLSMATDWAANNTSPNVNAGHEAAWLFDTYAAVATTPDAQGALQMAIWNTVWDTDFSVSYQAGSVYVNDSTNTNPLIGAANSYLAALQAADPNAVLAADASYYKLFDANGNQVQGFMGPADPPSAVPEPGSMLLLGSGLLGLAGLLRKRS